MNQSPNDNSSLPVRPLTSWQPGQAIPRPDVVMFEEFENYRESVPEGLEIEDVELIWWTVAACVSSEVLRGALARVITDSYDPSGHLFSPVADLEGKGRYPVALVALLRDILPKGGLLAVDSESLEGAEEPCDVAGSLIIQDQIWHELTWIALSLAPVEKLSDRLRDLRFSSDLGN